MPSDLAAALAGAMQRTRSAMIDANRAWAEGREITLVDRGEWVGPSWPTAILADAEFRAAVVASAREFFADYRHDESCDPDESGTCDCGADEAPEALAAHLLGTPR